MGKCKKTARQHLHPRHPLVRRPHRHHLQLPRVRRNGQILQILCRAIKKAGRGRLPICFFFPPVFVQIPALGTKKGSKSCFFLFTSIAKSAQAMSAYANAAGGICTKKRRGGIETPRRRAPKTRNSHDAVWCHFINLHVQGGSTAAACFCLPLDEGA